MLERNCGPTEVLVLNLMVEREINGPTEDELENKICDSLQYVEGVGKVEVLKDCDPGDENDSPRPKTVDLDEPGYGSGV